MFIVAALSKMRSFTVLSTTIIHMEKNRGKNITRAKMHFYSSFQEEKQFVPKSVPILNTAVRHLVKFIFRRVKSHCNTAT